MPQYPRAVFAGKAGNTYEALAVDTVSGALLTTDAGKSSIGGALAAHVTVASVVATVAGTLNTLSILADGSVAGAIYDAAALSLAGAANELATIPSLGGSVNPVINFNGGLAFSNGLCVSVGAGGGKVVAGYQLTE